MAFLHDDALYGQNNARLLDAAQFLAAILVQQGGLIVLPPKEEIERLTAHQVLGVEQDERNGQVLLTCVRQDGHD